MSDIEGKAEPVAWTSQEQLDKAKKSPGNNVLMWGEPLPYHDDIPLYTRPPEALAQEAFDRLERFPLTKLVNTNCTDVRAMWDTAADAQRRADLAWLRAALADGNPPK